MSKCVSGFVQRERLSRGEKRMLSIEAAVLTVKRLDLIILVASSHVLFFSRSFIAVPSVLRGSSLLFNISA